MELVFYAVRAHQVIDENECPQGTVMYTTHTHDGPWHDMVTGSLDYCWEVLDALQIVEELNRQKREQEQKDLLEYLESEHG